MIICKVILFSLPFLQSFSFTILHVHCILAQVTLNACYYLVRKESKDICRRSLKHFTECSFNAQNAWSKRAFTLHIITTFNFR